MKKGDVVIMNGKRTIPPGEEFRIWIVDSEPCVLMNEQVVLLEGRKGGYPVSGLTRIFGGEDEKD